MQKLQKKSIVILDTKCHYWDQVSLNNIKLKLKQFGIVFSHEIYLET